MLQGGNEWRYLKECLESGWVSSAGPFVERFEREVAALVGAQHAVAVASGTAALHTALRVVGVEPDEEVIVSDLTFIAPVNAIHYCGAHPVFMDADPVTWQMDARKLERFLDEECDFQDQRLIHRRTRRRIRAILPVHILGLACDMGRIMDAAEKYGLRVVEDAAEAMGVHFYGRHAGGFGDVGIFSFNGNKIVTAGGGGMVVTGDAGLARRARYLTTQAKDDEIESLHGEVGYNYRLTNIQAAVGLAQLERLEGFIERKRELAGRYEAIFSAVEGVTCMPSPPNTRPTYWLYTVLLPQGTLPDVRRAIIEELGENGFQARALWLPAHRQPSYRSSPAFEIQAADDLFNRGICLPSSVGLDPVDLLRCAETLVQIINRQRSGVAG
ncbi:MAG: LegC family aminotransferase [Candidatus Omnitrophica bacterium]|nr:LegC family aminotransferase [Candidatus Omnitrophota bacterium]